MSDRDCCPDCLGRVGLTSSKGDGVCRECKGTGEEGMVALVPKDLTPDCLIEECSECSGTGQCQTCGGEGWVYD